MMIVHILLLLANSLFQVTAFVASANRVAATTHLHAGPKTTGGEGTLRRQRSDSRSASAQRLAQRRKDQQEEHHLKKKEVSFDGKILTSNQNTNLDAPFFDLESAIISSSLRCMTPELQYGEDNETSKTRVFEYMSLDDLFEAKFGFSERFNADGDFRNQLRSAIRQDVFETTPFYANLSEKAASILLLPDSSLEGSWRIRDDAQELRMKHTTRVLQNAFQDTGHDISSIPTGDDLFRAIGKLCGRQASTHFIDIFGVQDRIINHSWHLDAGCSPGGCRTVLWGFPPEKDYSGCGVFSHVVSLKKQCLAPPSHNRMEPLLFEGSVPEDFIVRPPYEKGMELLMYRDIDVLHSAPDVAYRTSIMRFM
ncbi:hypothetical protein IV203_003499 [Nitzschia inconspicua]|uniref:Prolyl 4-hydroxylase alpha subunit domain-containing protein n=1 Tax=Nitzschia inconspicua TaxID=303405 RepID=A0A9K3L1Y8_9STRA|nr:hypothetical protein IV203_003499 [Nitzschia inconspicua]